MFTEIVKMLGYTKSCPLLFREFCFPEILHSVFCEYDSNRRENKFHILSRSHDLDFSDTSVMRTLQSANISILTWTTNGQQMNISVVHGTTGLFFHMNVDYFSLFVR